MQIDIGKQRRDRRSLGRPYLRFRPVPVFRHSGCQPIPDQPRYPRIRDPQLDQLHQLFMADIVEKALDIGIQYPVHLLRHDSRRERVQRVLRAAPRPETIRETGKVLLVNLLENRCHSLLHDFVFHRRNPATTGILQASTSKEHAISPNIFSDLRRTVNRAFANTAPPGQSGFLFPWFRRRGRPAFEEHAQNGARRERVPDPLGGARRTLCASEELTPRTPGISRLRGYGFLDFDKLVPLGLEPVASVWLRISSPARRLSVPRWMRRIRPASSASCRR